MTHRYPLLLVFYGITLGPLAEELWAAYLWSISPFYMDDAVFDGSARRSLNILKLLMERSPDWGYFLKPANSLFISDTLEREEAYNRELAA